MLRRLTVAKPARWATLAGLVALLGLAAVGPRGAVLGQSNGPAPPQLSVGFGPEQVWRPPSALFQQLLECRRAYSCVAELMQRTGASEGAIAFYHLTSWFLWGLQDTGIVQLGTIFTPWRANENTQLALLGGTPAVIFIEGAGDGGQFGVTYNADFLALRAVYPNIAFWSSGARFEGVTADDSGGQRFTFGYRLLDGCHLCPVLGTANVAFDFAADGTYLGPTLLSVEPKTP